MNKTEKTECPECGMTRGYLSSVTDIDCRCSNDRPESERQILRCAPPFDAQAEHEADLRYESRVDDESWQYDRPEDL
jgi:hypothetical protein